jgi:uncharacterized membrane protein YdfJ with MMPL/SSD domain
MYRRRWAVIGVWSVVFVAALVGASQVGSVLGPGDFTQTGTDSARAASILSTKFHQSDDRVTLVVVENPRLTVHDAAYRTVVAGIVRRIRVDSGLQTKAIDNPLLSGNRQAISLDGHGVALTVVSGLKEEYLEGQIDPLRALVATPGYVTHVTGTAAVNHDSNVQSKKDLATGEEISVPILLLILLVVFGTLIAAGLPLLLAGVSIVLSLAVVYIFGHVVNTSVYVTNVVTVLGLGIGIDYSLFIMYRFREELERTGNDVERAIVRTMETTGRSVVFAGLTVATGLATLVLTGISFMQSMGLGGMLVPFTSLLVALTLLPAVLSVIGPGVNRLRVVPRSYLRTGERGFWHRLALGIMRRPLLSGGAVVIVLLAVTLPVLNLQIANGSLKNEPQSQDSIAGLRVMQAHFPSAPNPTELVISMPAGALSKPGPIAAMLSLESSIRRDSEVADVTGLPDILKAGVTNPAVTGQYLSADHTTGIIDVTARDDFGTAQVSAMVHRMRQIAATSSLVTHFGATVNVGGAAAEFTDFDDTLYSKFPWIVAVVLALTYAFLFYAFRSVFLPLKAVVLNLLSVGAAYGMLELVFQRGVGAGLMHFTPESGVAGWVPIFLFAFLFGLSMDYEVFLLSRMRERWLTVRDNRDAVAFGLEKTGRLITSAALIMMIAFGAFIVGSQVQLKELGFGLLAAVALDASLIRIVLVPSIMQLMGDRNWWIPAFLQRFAPHDGGFSEQGYLPEPVPVLDEVGV